MSGTYRFRPKGILSSQRAVSRGRRYDHTTSKVHLRRLRLLARVHLFFKGLLRSPDGGFTAEQRTIKLRAIRSGFFVVSTLLIGRILLMQTEDHDRWLSLATRQHQTSVKIDGARGSILDRAGREIALSIETFSIGIHPRRLKDLSAESAKISTVLKLEPKALEQTLKKRASYVHLARDVSREQLNELRALSVPGLEVETEFRRHYPQGELARTIVGSVGVDGRGQSGIELKFDQELRAATQVLHVRRDALGRLLPGAPSADTMFQTAASKWREFIPGSIAPELAFARERDAVTFREEGGDLELSIDSVLQQILEEEFRAGREKAQAKRVFGLVLDAQTGEILALGQALKDAPETEGSKVSSPEQLRNVTLQDSFEPGSTFKPVVAALALSKGLVRSAELINCENGNYRFGPHTIRDVHPIGVVSVKDVLIRSSNIGMTKIGVRLGATRLHDSLEEMGFGSASGIELSGEGKGILRSLNAWRPIDVATHSFGQGISVTAVQLTRAYAALANGGILIRPTILKQDTPANGVRVFSKNVSDAVTKALVGVVTDEHGTGKEASINGLSVSGKTGTAQKARTNGRGYDPDRILASFVGYVDAAQLGINKKLVMFVGVDEPGVKPRWGGVVAAPVFRRTMERILSQLLHTNSAGSVASLERPGKRG